MLTKISLLAVLFAFCQTALALGEPVVDGNQLVGCWKREIYSQDAMNRISTFDIYDPTLQKYQWFCFQDKGGLPGDCD